MSYSPVEARPDADGSALWRARALLGLKMALATWIVFTGVMFALMLGSGVCAVPLSVYLLSAAAVALGYGAIVSVMPSRLTCITQVVLLLGSLVLVGSIFMQFYIGGMNLAKDYGSRLAESVEAYHRTTGEWPKSLSELPTGSLPKLDPREVVPYLCDTEIHGSETKIGGFFVVYGLSPEDGPWLRVSRRDELVVFDWETKTWLDVSPRPVNLGPRPL